jgi:hypothetical protein
MTLTFDLETDRFVGIPINPNINIELGRFLYVPQVEICKNIKNEISMFLSVADDEIFQAGLSNIENIINLFKYAN